MEIENWVLWVSVFFEIWSRLIYPRDCLNPNFLFLKVMDEPWKTVAILDLCCLIQWPSTWHGYFSLNWVKMKWNGKLSSSVTSVPLQVLSMATVGNAEGLGTSQMWGIYVSSQCLFRQHQFGMWESCWVILKSPYHRGSFSELWNKNSFWEQHIVFKSFYIVYVALYYSVLWSSLGTMTFRK